MPSHSTLQNYTKSKSIENKEESTQPNHLSIEEVLFIFSREFLATQRIECSLSFDDKSEIGCIISILLLQLLGSRMEFREKWNTYSLSNSGDI